MTKVTNGNDCDLPKPIPVLYITCSSFSGSTLLSFLLNNHPCVVTIGHTTGWAFGKDDDFRCSCGQALGSCPFYRSIEKAYGIAGLAFDIRDFGTEYRLSKNDRINDILVGGLPRLRISRLEVMRDQFVQHIPWWFETLERQDEANFLLMKSALEQANANVYVDNSHRPHRLRQLRRAGMFDLRVLHLVRDVRGVVLSNLKRTSMDAALATRVWLGEQANILRIGEEFPNRMLLHYDDLCDNLDTTLGRIHRFMGLEPTPFCGDFMRGEHHILGNQMRLRDGTVARDTKWKDELSEKDIQVIRRTASSFVNQNQNSDLTRILSRYFANRGLEI